MNTSTAGSGTNEEGAAGLPEPQNCGLCGVRLVPDGSRYCSLAHREEAMLLGDIE